jgi:hypothetical protein
MELYLRSPYVFMAWCLINEAQGQLYCMFTFTNMAAERAKECHDSLE